MQKNKQVEEELALYKSQNARLEKDIDEAVKNGVPKRYTKEQLEAPPIERIMPIVYSVLSKCGTEIIEKTYDYFAQVNSMWQDLKNRALKDNLEKEIK